MSTLHIVSKSPFRTDALQRCLSLVAPGDSIILIEDGVLAVNLSILGERISGTDVSCFALAGDLIARSLTTAGTEIQQADAASFVALVCEHRNSISYG
ncbi:sulfurtransferase complex subunit TusB [Pseudohongiella sp.]|uniref:Sulfurtransferase complex subunit TusB n=1 Tax=marine sediment metagenome TaxID=412755 RepID=A0A0F9YEC0_9ZZZZ|nr:sulfurtransferase complex subunit TusB [Pseudohongiella sp.]